jgi:hypothetical protein
MRFRVVLGSVSEATGMGLKSKIYGWRRGWPRRGGLAGWLRGLSTGAAIINYKGGVECFKLQAWAVG